MVAWYLRMSYGCAHAYGYGHTTKLVQLVTTLLLALFQIINALKGDLQFTQPGEESGIIWFYSGLKWMQLKKLDSTTIVSTPLSGVTKVLDRSIETLSLES